MRKGTEHRLDKTLGNAEKRRGRKIAAACGAMALWVMFFHF